VTINCKLQFGVMDCTKVYIFYKIFKFSTGISIFYRNLNFLPEFRFASKVYIFNQNLNFLPKFRFATKVYINLFF